MNGVARRVAALCLAVACGAALAQGGAPPPARVERVQGSPAVEARVTPEEAAGLWRAARWGMTVDEVLKAFPGEARRLDPELKLADGNVVAAGIAEQAVAGQVLVVRFVFEGGKLGLVSLRTPQGTYAGDQVYDRIREHLRTRLGSPDYAVTEKPLVEQRQTRWALKRGVVDLKAIPGTVVLMYSAPPAPGRAGR